MKSDIANIRKQQRRWWNWCTNDVNWYLCLFRHHIPVILSHEVTHDKVFVTVPLVILLNVPYFPHRLYLNYMRWTLDKYCRISTNFFYSFRNSENFESKLIKTTLLHIILLIIDYFSIVPHSQNLLSIKYFGII